MRPSRYFLVLVVACLMFAGQGTAIKYLNRQLTPIQITFLPFATATLCLLPLVARARRTSPTRTISAADWGRFAVAGVGGQVVAQLGVVTGVTRSLASNASVLSLLLPVISTVLAAIFLRERITRVRFAALAIGLIGVFLLSAESVRESALGEMRFLTGNLLILAGLTGSAFYNVYCKGLFAKFSQIEVLVFTYIAASVAGLLLLVLMEPPRLELFRALTWQSWAGFAYQAIVTYGLAMLLFFYALKHLDVSTASLSLYLLPVFGVVLAALLLGERLGALALAGSGVVLISTLLVVRYDRATAR